MVLSTFPVSILGPPLTTLDHHVFWTLSRVRTTELLSVSRFHRLSSVRMTWGKSPYGECRIEKRREEERRGEKRREGNRRRQ